MHSISKNNYLSSLAIIISIMCSVFLGLFFYIATSVIYILILYNILLGFAIGFIVTFLGPYRNNYTREGRLLLLAFFCSLTSYLTYHFTTYLIANEQLRDAGISIDFISFMWFKANLETFTLTNYDFSSIGNAIKTGVEQFSPNKAPVFSGALLNISIWLFEIIFSALFAWNPIKKACEGKEGQLIPPPGGLVVYYFKKLTRTKK